MTRLHVLRRPQLLATVSILSLAVLGTAATTPVRAAESRIPISKPTTITTPGSYVLTRDLAGTGDQLVIATGPVVLDLNGHSVTGTDANTIPLRVTERGNAIVRNGTVTSGANYSITAEGRNGSFPRLVLDEVEVTGATTTALYATDVLELTVTNSRLHDCAGGISVSTVATRGMLHVANDRIQVGRRGIDLGGLLPLMGDVSDNVIVAGLDTGLAIGGNVGALGVRRNTITTGGGAGVYAGGVGGHAIEANVVRQTAGVGIQVFSDGNRVTGNVVTGSASTGIEVSGHYNIVEQNTLANNAGYGVYLIGDWNAYRNNLSRNNGAGDYRPGGNTDGGGNL